MNTFPNRKAFTLLEIVLAVVIMTVVATVSLQHLQPAGVTSQQRACDVARQAMQNHADRYFASTGNWPSRDLGELQSDIYAGTTLPRCPCQGDSYQMSGAIVICPTHEASRR